MLVAIQPIDLAAFFSLGVLWLALGVFVVTLYSWLWRTGRHGETPLD